MTKVVTAATHIAAPPAQVFAAISDLAGAPGRCSDIIKLEILTDGPVGVGTRFRETRRMFKKEASETMEITAFDPPRGYTTTCDSHGFHYVSTLRISPQAGGSLLQLIFHGQAQTRSAKIMSVLMGWMMKSMCGKVMQRDLEGIKLSIEGGRQPAAKPATSRRGFDIVMAAKFV